MKARCREDSRESLFITDIEDEHCSLVCVITHVAQSHLTGARRMRDDRRSGVIFDNVLFEYNIFKQISRKIPEFTFDQ